MDALPLAAEKRPASSGLLATAAMHAMLNHVETTASRGAFTTGGGVVKSVDAVDRYLRATCSRRDELAAARGETCRLRRRRQHPPPSSSRVQRNPFPAGRCSKAGPQPPQPPGIGRLLSRVSRITPRRALDRHWGIAWLNPFEVRADALKAASSEAPNFMPRRPASGISQWMLLLVSQDAGHCCRVIL